MAQKRIQYVKTATGLEKQLIASSADIVEIEAIDGLDATNVQDALEQLTEIASEGGVTGVKGDAETTYRQGQVNITKSNIGLGNVTNDAQVKRSEMGVAGGVATLDTTGKVPSSQLPSYVDDIVMGYYNPTDGHFYGHSSYTAATKITPDTGKIYVDQNTNIPYRAATIDGNYVEVSQSLALGETSSTAYPGDKGAANASQIEGHTELIRNALNAISNLENGTTKAGVAVKADALSSAKQIQLKGDAIGFAEFDGTAHASIDVDLAATGVNAGTYSAVAVDAKGRVTAGSQIIEWGGEGQASPTANLAVGGLFFQLVE